MPKPILCLDFDGVIHSYTSGWEGPEVISDPPVPGAMEFMVKAFDHFTIAIFSSRSGQDGGMAAMQDYVRYHLTEQFGAAGQAMFHAIMWPVVKPAAFLTIDDRAITFTGEWPEPKSLFDFRVWYKNPKEAR